MNDILKFIDIYIKRFNRPIEDLDDVRYAMATLKQLRNEEIKIDMDIEPIEVGIFEVLPNFLDGFPFRLINNIQLLFDQLLLELGDHHFSRHTKFSEKLPFLTP